MKTRVISTVISAIALFGLIHTEAQVFLEETVISPPEFPAKEIKLHGEDVTSITSFISQNVTYPSDYHWAGTAVVHFKVSETGEITSVEILNSVSPSIDRQVVQILETSSGNWIPGTVDGENVAMNKEIALVFKPSPGFDITGNARKLQDKANKLMFGKNNPKRALKFYSQAAKLLPYEESILAGKCLCHYVLGDDEGYLEDLERLMSFHSDSTEIDAEESQAKVNAQLRILAMQYSDHQLQK